MEEEYIIYLLDHDAVCPVCKGRRIHDTRAIDEVRKHK